MFRRPSLIRPASLGRMALTSAVAGLLLVAGASLGADDKIRQNEKALDSLRGKIGELQQKLERDQAAQDSAQKELQAVERRVSEASQSLAALRRRIDAQSRKIKETQDAEAEERRALDARRGELARQLRAAYVMGRQGETQLILNVDDVQQLGRMLTYYDYLQRAQLKLIDSISTRAEELQRLADQQQQQQAELESLRSEQEAVLEALKKGRETRAGMVTELKTKLASDKGSLAQLKAEERDIRKLIESLRRVAEEEAAARARSKLPPEVPPSGSAFSAQKGKLPWPARGKLLARYGEQKAGGPLTWNGHWIDAAAGSPVRAVARGRVVYVGWMHRYGLIVLVEHDSGYYTLYGHCQSANAAVGDPVSAGQSIAAAGDTGGYEQSGVYFEIRKGTSAVDPRQWLAK